MDVSTPASPPRVAGGAWLIAVIAAAAVQLLAQTALAAQHAAWFAGGHPQPAAVLVVGGVVLVAAMVAAVFAFDEVSGWARAAVVLVAVQATIAVAALVLWQLALGDAPFFADAFPLAAAVPGPALVASGLVVLAALVAPASSTPPRWLTAVVALALASLVVAALWVPLFAALAEQDIVDAATVPAAVPVVLGPTLGIAAVVAAIAVWRPGWLRLRATGAVGLAWLVAMAAVFGEHGGELARPWAHLVTQFAPLLLGLAWFATLAVGALAIVHVRSARRVVRLRRAARTCRGTIVVEAPGDPTVAVLVNLGWLAGMVPACRGFTLRTGRGKVEIPAGVDVVAATPPWAAQASAGAAVAVLRAGDEVDVLGFEPEPEREGDAYRGSTAPVLGTRGVAVVAPRRDDEPVLRDVLLRLWQPCAVLLAACAIAAVPTLVIVLA